MDTLDHMGFNVSDFELTRKFLVAALAPLGIRIVRGGKEWAMLGRSGRGQFWFGAYGPSPGPLHVAFSAETREQVRQFHAAALAAGGRDNGPPGIRAQYHPDYYAAFVIGPDGHNLEAVCHAPAE